MYSVKEIFYTLQGEGAHAGRPAVFCRFTGCNLWSGREVDRAGAQCTFCDTEFVGTDGTDGPGGGQFADADALGEAIDSAWAHAMDNSFVVLTGGEPMLQVDDALVDQLHRRGFEIAIETNGTLDVTPDIDWVCVSPKAGTELVQTTGDELKLVYPQADLEPQAVADLEFDRFYLQPMDGPQIEANTAAAVSYAKTHPQWRLSIQTHKLLGIP